MLFYSTLILETAHEIKSLQYFLKYIKRGLLDILQILSESDFWGLWPLTHCGIYV